MNKRPLGIILPCLLLFFEPILKIGLQSLLTGESIDVILNYKLDDKLFLATYYLAGPICAIFLYKVKWYVPITFLPLSGWIFYSNLLQLKIVKESGDVNAMIIGAFALVIFGFGITMSLLPKTILLYFKPSLRWWEQNERFQILLDCKINNNMSGRIDNISESGAFIAMHETVPIDEIFNIKFRAADENLSLDAKIIYRVPLKNQFVGYGVHFVSVDVYLKDALKVFIKSLQNSNTSSIR